MPYFKFHDIRLLAKVIVFLIVSRMENQSRETAKKSPKRVKQTVITSEQSRVCFPFSQNTMLNILKRVSWNEKETTQERIQNELWVSVLWKCFTFSECSTKRNGSASWCVQKVAQKRLSGWVVKWRHEYSLQFESTSWNTIDLTTLHISRRIYCSNHMTSQADVPSTTKRWKSRNMKGDNRVRARAQIDEEKEI